MISAAALTLYPRHLRCALFVAAPIASGLLALWLGMDASWDLRNYHYYNGWALLSGHLDRDLLLAQTPSFYNPTIDLPYAWAEPRLDARLLAFILGGLQGVNVILLTLLGEVLLPVTDARRRLAWAALAAAVGCCGAVTLSESGTVFYDSITSLGLFAGLLLLLRRWPLVGAAGAGNALLAGLPLGLAFGLKQTMIAYPLGLGLALLLTLPGPKRRRLAVTLALALGVTLGTLATGGWWMLRLARLYGNPLFPYFNQLFQSAWAQAGDYRDIHFAPQGLWRWLLFPWLVAADSRLASEVDFTDFRIAALFLAIPLAPMLGVRWSSPRALLLLTALLSYLVWLALFDIYRYLVALEMLAPLALALILLGSPLPARQPLTLLLLVLLLLTTRPAEWLRVPFRARAVEVSLPRIDDPDHSLVLLAGHEPLSFLVPSFPDSMVFLRIDSTFTNPDQTAVPFNGVMRRRIEAHRGPLLALFIPREQPDVIKRLGNLGLGLDSGACRPVTSPIGAGAYALCAVTR